MSDNTSRFSAFRIVHRGMFIGQLVFLGVLCFFVYRKITVPALVEYDKTLQVISLLFSAAGLFAGNMIFKRRIAAIRENTNASVKEKFEMYRAASIIQWALLEAAVLFCGICFLLVGNYSFLALALLLAVIFFMLGPGKMKIALQTGINPAEAEDL